MTVQFRVLGPLEVRTSDGRPVRLGADKHRALLAALLLSANQSVDIHRLVEVLWSDRPPRSVESAMRTYVSALRGLLNLSATGSTTRIVARGRAYQIRLDRDDLDLLVFDDLAVRGQKALTDGDPTTAARLLQRALELWRGRALEDVPLDHGLHADLERLDELRLTALEAWIEARLALGGHADVIAELPAQVAAQPLRERLQGLWMLALYRCGRQAAALAVYREVRAQLVADLGLDPSPPLQRLHRQILTGDPALDPPAGHAVVVPRQLPADPAAFTGREDELARLHRLVRPGRGHAAPVIAAIDGVAGVGKSALAVHAAHRLATRFPDGCLYADLRGATTDGPGAGGVWTDERSEEGRRRPEGAGARASESERRQRGPGPAAPLAVLCAFLRALGAPDRDLGSLDEAAARFRALTADRRLLVVLDNARDAAQIQPLLPAAAGCAVIVTSRRVLATVDGVATVHLGVLTAPDAVTLLGRLAGAERIAADPDVAAEVADRCGHLPLALRIAGARLTARPGWPVRALADRLADAHRRLDELQAGDLGVRASFQVSLDALGSSADPADRAAAAAFPLVAVPDGADLGTAVAARLLDRPEPAAEAVLERLVDAQLLDSPAPGRYRLHDLIRLFARECAADGRAAALIRVLAWYREVACRSLELLRPGHRHPVLATGRSDVDVPFDTAPAAVDWLEAERANLVAVIAQAAADEAVPAALPVAIAQALCGFFQVRGHWHDWIEVSRTALAAAGDPAGRGYAHRDLGVAHELRGDYDQARADLSASLDLFARAGDAHGRAAALTSLGIIHHRQGRYGCAVACFQESITIRRGLGDTRGRAINLSNVGVTHQRTGRYADADAFYREALEIFQHLDDQPGTGSILTNLGVVCESRELFDDAAGYHERSLAIFRELGDRTGEATSLHNLGRARRRLGRLDEALACQHAGLAISEQLGEWFYRAECLRELGNTWRAAGDPVRARRHWEQAHEVFAALGVPEAAEVAAQISDS